MFRLPIDVENDLQKRYPMINVKNFVNSLFQAIVEKVISDSSCQIRELGKFVAFITYSSRLSRNVVRFKFKPSQSFTKKIREDNHILQTLPVRANVPFTEANESNCANKRDRRDANFIAQAEASILSKKRTNEKTALNEISKVLEKY